MALQHSPALSIKSSKLDMLYNALVIGMDKDDAYIFASFTEAEIAEASSDEVLQQSIAYYSKDLEYKLLSKLQEVVDKQTHMGKENAITWWLEKINPRYSNKPKGDLPDLHIHLADTDPADMDTVTINHAPSQSVSNTDTETETETDAVETIKEDDNDGF